MTVQHDATGRAHALSWAADARAARHGVRHDLSTGATSLAQVLAAGRSEDLLGRARLLWVLESLPGARKSDTRRMLTRLGLDGDRPIASLDDEERRLIGEIFDPASPAR